MVGALGLTDEPAGVEHPRVQQGQSGADVAQREGQVDRLAGRLRRRTSPATWTQWESTKPTFWSSSLSLDGISIGLIADCNVRSASRAELFDDRTAAKVAAARTRVPAAVPISATVAQSMAALCPSAFARVGNRRRRGWHDVAPVRPARWVLDLVDASIDLGDSAEVSMYELRADFPQSVALAALAGTRDRRPG